MTIAGNLWMLSKLRFIRSPRQIFEFLNHFRSNLRKFLINFYKLKRTASNFRRDPWESFIYLSSLLAQNRENRLHPILGKKRLNCKNGSKLAQQSDPKMSQNDRLLIASQTLYFSQWSATSRSLNVTFDWVK